MSALLVGIDPSYSRTGLAFAYLDETKQIITKISLDWFSKEKSTEKDVQTLYHLACFTVESLIAKIQHHGVPQVIISEEPFPGGIYSAGLFGLDFLLYRALIDKFNSDIYNLSPTYLGFLHKTRKYAKSDSVKMAKEIMDRLTNYGIEIDVPKRFPHDAAEAFLFLCRLLVKLNLVAPGGDYHQAFKGTRFEIEKEKKLFTGRNSNG